ncbi:MAG: hypothetical protein LVS60_12045 [Nodosilinea sp. LVE1205-7]|jgi:uncharacterized membrane protein
MTSFNVDLVNRDYEFKMGQYFSRGWQIFTAYGWQFVLFTLIYLGLSLAVSQVFPETLAVIFNNIITPVLGVGYLCVAFQIARGRPKTFADFFGGFRKFLPVLLTSLVSSLLICLGLILLVIPGIYLAVAYVFAQPLVIDKHLDFWSAMETSRRIITKKWFSFFGLGLLLFLLILVSLMALGVGILVGAPLASCIIAAAYEDIVGLNSVAEP